MLESKKAGFPAKYHKKIRKYEEILFGSTLAEDLFISILEEGDSNQTNEEILNCIFEIGIKNSEEVSPNFIETVKSFYRNGFNSAPLGSLIAFLEKKHLLVSSVTKGPQSQPERLMQSSHSENDASDETL